MGSTWVSHVTLDPQEMESKYSTEDGMGNMDSIFEDLDEESSELLERVKDILQNLPQREADFIELYYFKKLKQIDIANLFRVSQPTVCYRLQRAASRIHFLLSLPHYTEAFLEETLRKNLVDDLDVAIMTHMYKTTCQSEVAKCLGVSQGLVRHRFLRSIIKLKKCEGIEEVAEVFVKISDNLNILREVERSSWESRTDHILL